MNTPDSPTAGEPGRFPTLAKVGPPVGRWFGRCLVVVFGLLVFYVLSMGPAVQLNKRGLISPETLEKVYSPLSFIIDIPGTQWLLDRYVRLWADPGPGHD